MKNDIKTTATMSTNGRVTLPAELRRKLMWHPGMRLIVEEVEDGVLLNAANGGPGSQDAGGLIPVAKPTGAR